MAMFSVTRGKVEFESLFGLKRTEEQVLGCLKVEPGDYHLAHGFVEMDVKVDPDDSVLVKTASIMSGRSIKDIKFGGSTLALPVLQELNALLNFVPKFGETALKVGPDDNGITLSLERYANENVAPVAIGTLAIESAIKPARSKKERSATFGGAAGS